MPNPTMQTTPRRSGRTPSPFSSTSACLKPWRWPAVKFRRRRVPADLTGKILDELAAETLLRSSEIRFVARGTSMLPAIVPGDCLTIKSFSPGEVPSYGEALLVHRDGEFRIHRLVRVLDNTPQHIYILRGDALLQDDPPVFRCQILGRVTSLQRAGPSFPLAATSTP